MSNDSLPPLTLHIGLPKCASSSLQRFLQNAETPYFYMGKFKRDHRGLAYQNEEIEAIFRTTIPLSSEIIFNYEEIRSRLKAYFAEYNPQNKPALLSEEVMSGMGVIMHQNNRQLDPYIILHRMKQLFPNLKLLLIIREQFKYLQSYYSELISQGYNIAYDIFVRKHIREHAGLGYILKYDEFASFLIRTCGEVYILPFESLIRQDDLATSTLAKLDISFTQDFPKARKSALPNEVHHKFVANLDQVTRLGSLQSLYDLSRSHEVIQKQNIRDDVTKLFWLDPHFQAACSKLFSKSNYKLQEMLNINLHEYGYQ